MGYELNVYGKLDGVEEVFIRQCFNTREEAESKANFYSESDYIANNYDYKLTRCKIESY